MKITIMLLTNEKKYWSEIVTSQPDSFVIGKDGNITISDAEGFAWIISVVNGLNGEKENSLVSFPEQNSDSIKN